MKKTGNEKFGKNKWLINDEFMSRIDFFDKYYIKELGHKLKHFLEHIPINVITTWDSKNKRIYFKIGSDILYYFPVDVNVSYNDYITLVEDKIKKHYPSYCVSYDDYREYNEDDIRQIQKETGKNLSEIVWEKKKINVIEKGTLIKINMPEDEFIFNFIRDGVEKKEKRICTYRKIGIDEKKVLDTFLKDLRGVIVDGNDSVVRDFILLNSEKIEDIISYTPPAKIDYDGEMLLNFFKINKKFINEKAICLDTNLYKWGNYEVFFQNDILKKDCLKLIEVENLMYK